MILKFNQYKAILENQYKIEKDLMIPAEEKMKKLQSRMETDNIKLKSAIDRKDNYHIALYKMRLERDKLDIESTKIRRKIEHVEKNKKPGMIRDGLKTGGEKKITKPRTITKKKGDNQFAKKNKFS